MLLFDFDSSTVKHQPKTGRSYEIALKTFTAKSSDAEQHLCFYPSVYLYENLSPCNKEHCYALKYIVTAIDNIARVYLKTQYSVHPNFSNVLIINGIHPHYIYTYNSCIMACFSVRLSAYRSCGCQLLVQSFIDSDRCSNYIKTVLRLLSNGWSTICAKVSSQ